MSLSAMLIFGFQNFLPGILWNEKLAPKIRTRFPGSIYGDSFRQVCHVPKTSCATCSAGNG